MKKLLETISRLDEKQLDEATFDREIDEIVSGLPERPTREELLDGMERALEVQASGFLSGVTNRLAGEGFKKQQYFGKVAKKLGLPGLYQFPEGNLFHSTETDEEGRHRTSRGASLRSAIAVANFDPQLIPDPKMERLRSNNPDEPAFQADDSEDRPQSSADQDPVPTSGPARLSDGTEIDSLSERDINRIAGEKMERIIELLGVRNESKKFSLDLYKEISESTLNFLFERDFTAEEAEELRALVSDLKLLEPNLSGTFQRQAQTYIRDAEAVLPPAPEADPEDEETPDDVDSRDSGLDSGDPNQPEEPADDDTPSGNLEAFARSGKGGLANDPEEEEAIRELQEYLNDLGFDTGTVDGKYGPATRRGVRAFQEFMGATVDGDAGPQTISAIVRLRSISYDSGKTFADFRRELSRAEELIQKAGTETANDSIDFRNLISIVEGRLLTEALTDEETQELQDILDRLDGLANDAEWSTALPQPTQDRLSDILDQGRQVAPAQDDQPSTEGPYTIDMEITDELNDKLEAVGQTRGIVGEPLTAEDVAALNQGVANGTIEGPTDTTAPAPPTVDVGSSTTNGVAPESEQEDDYIILYWEGEKYYINPQPDAQGVYRGSTRRGGNDARVSNPDLLAQVEAEASRRSEAASSEQPAQATPEPTAGPDDGTRGGQQPNAPAAEPATSTDSVPPRPSNSNTSQRGRNLRSEQTRWDSQYGETHNTDGSPKTAQESMADILSKLTRL